MANVIISKTYRLTAPGVIEEENIKREVKDNWVVVRPTMVSACQADLRYFNGKRRQEALNAKLPMALFHEGVGVVIKSNSVDFLEGDRVIIVPNIPGYVLAPEKYNGEEGVPDNYVIGTEFLGSGYDGIGQSDLVHPAECLVKIPDEVSDKAAVLSEMSTISYFALSHVSEKIKDKNTKIAVFGDGPVGYLTSLIITFMFDKDSEQFTVFGADRDRLSNFTFVDTKMVQDYNIKNSKEKFDIIIEATGGEFSSSAINQAIEIIKPLGDLILLGVSEDLVPINTRDILEKGIRLYGSSRSSTSDFEAVVKEMKNLNFQESLLKLLPEKEFDIYNSEDLVEALKFITNNTKWEKSIIKFHF